ncbi:MAG TPA: hypothetical protein VGJ05_06085 [Fimbriiglobus sp.]|jgi:short-subunit dehydrogenase
MSIEGKVVVIARASHGIGAGLVSDSATRVFGVVATSRSIKANNSSIPS